jgi:hypothetical protein
VSLCIYCTLLLLLAHALVCTSPSGREIAHFRAGKGKKGRKSAKEKIKSKEEGEGASSAECTTMSLQFFISSDINLPVAIKMYLLSNQLKLH